MTIMNCCYFACAYYFIGSYRICLKAQQKIMGHSDIAMTLKYSHFAKEDLANAMLLLEDELCMSVPECNKSATNFNPTLN